MGPLAVEHVLAHERLAGDAREQPRLVATLDQLGQGADQHQRASLGGLGVLGSEPHSADLAVDVLPAQRCDLALSHAGDESESYEVLEPIG